MSEIKLIIKDEKNEGLEFATAYNETAKTGGKTNEKGEVTISANLGDKIRVSYVGKETIFFIVTSFNQKKISLVGNKKLKEVVIKGKRIDTKKDSENFMLLIVAIAVLILLLKFIPK
jgi:hypothetical protein